ncbi:MAG: carbon storage regulator [Pirellulales bacterium]
MAQRTDEGNARGNLVITREKHQSIEIEGGITITVVRGSCQLKIQAPQNVSVMRSELLEKAIPLKLPRFAKLQRDKLRRRRGSDQSTDPAPAA